MRYFKHRDHDFPVLGIGTYRVGGVPSLQAEEIEILQRARSDYHFSLIDTAEMYGAGNSELLVGKYLKEQQRDDWFVVDKIMPSHAVPGRFEQHCRESLERLGVDYLDLYLLHWRDRVRLQTMVDEMENLVAKGLIRHWGVSNFDVSDMEDLFQCEGGSNCFANQFLYNLSSRGVEYDLIPWCKAHDVLIMTYSPLGNEILKREAMTKDANVRAIAERHHVPAVAVVLAFVVRNNDLITVFKTSSHQHLVENMQVLDFQLDDEDMQLLEQSFPAPRKKESLKKI